MEAVSYLCQDVAQDDRRRQHRSSSAARIAAPFQLRSIQTKTARKNTTNDLKMTNNETNSLRETLLHRLYVHIRYAPSSRVVARTNPQILPIRCHNQGVVGRKQTYHHYWCEDYRQADEVPPQTYRNPGHGSRLRKSMPSCSEPGDSAVCDLLVILHDCEKEMLLC